MISKQSSSSSLSISTPIRDFILSEAAKTLLQQQKQQNTNTDNNNNNNNQEDESPPSSPITIIQNLWAGYGHIIRLRKNTIETISSTDSDLVIKIIDCPVTDDLNSSASHLRKLKSYEIEINFYQKVLTPLKFNNNNNNNNHGCSSNLSTVNPSSIPMFAKCFEAGDLFNSKKNDGEIGNNNSSNNNNNHDNNNNSSSVKKYLALQDLSLSGFSRSVSRFFRPIPADAISSALKWLSQFHALFMVYRGKFVFLNNNVMTKESLLAENCVWPQGCYWNFGTRQDEWKKMNEMMSTSSSDQEGGLQFLTEFAPNIDKTLFSSDGSTITTSNDDENQIYSLCHGDPKLENICFASSSSSSSSSSSEKSSTSACAFVDFQYVGFGNPIVDVAGFSTYVIEASLGEESETFSNNNNDEIIDSTIAKFLNEYRSHLHESIETLFHQNDLITNDEKNGIKNLVEEKWIKLFPLGVADYSRFYLGWKKGATFEKLPKWQRRMCEKAKKMTI